jgi:hypothetical protein
MKIVVQAAALAVLSSCLATAAFAEEWTDYAPMKGAYVKTMIRVEPAKIDDYLTNVIKKVWIPSQESAKRHGLIDTYTVQVKSDPNGPGPNVALIIHYPTMAAMDPDKARDQAMDKEFQAIQPRSEEPAIVAERAKYRTVLSEEMWTSVDFAK